jgi:hypothetical protein
VHHFHCVHSYYLKIIKYNIMHKFCTLKKIFYSTFLDMFVLVILLVRLNVVGYVGVVNYRELCLIVCMCWLRGSEYKLSECLVKCFQTS